MRGGMVVLATALGVACAPGADEPGGAGAAPPAPEITAVAGIPWGFSADSIVARRSEPLARRPDFGGVQLLTYREILYGAQVELVYLVDPRAGMIRGAYTWPVGSGEECTHALGSLDRGVTSRYPELVPAEEKAGAGDPCALAISGKGSYMKLWTDPANGARIGLFLFPPGSSVALLYSTAEGDEWERQKNASQF